MYDFIMLYFLLIHNRILCEYKNIIPEEKTLNNIGKSDKNKDAI